MQKLSEAEDKRVGIAGAIGWDMFIGFLLAQKVNFCASRKPILLQIY